MSSFIIECIAMFKKKSMKKAQINISDEACSLSLSELISSSKEAKKMLAIDLEEANPRVLFSKFEEGEIEYDWEKRHLDEAIKLGNFTVLRIDVEIFDSYKRKLITVNYW